MSFARIPPLKLRLWLVLFAGEVAVVGEVGDDGADGEFHGIRIVSDENLT